MSALKSVTEVFQSFHCKTDSKDYGFQYAYYSIQIILRVANAVYNLDQILILKYRHTKASTEI